jgi:hypothetical protein
MSLLLVTIGVGRSCLFPDLSVDEMSLLPLHFLRA